MTLYLFLIGIVLLIFCYIEFFHDMQPRKKASDNSIFKPEQGIDSFINTAGQCSFYTDWPAIYYNKEDALMIIYYNTYINKNHIIYEQTVKNKVNLHVPGVPSESSHRAHKKP